MVEGYICEVGIKSDRGDSESLNITCDIVVVFALVRCIFDENLRATVHVIARLTH